MIDTKDTRALIDAVERSISPAAYLLDTFFPQMPAAALSSIIEVQYMKGKRKLAPFIAESAEGVAVAREAYETAMYKPPIMAPRRLLDPKTLEEASLGETVYSPKSAADRAADYQAKDLADLQAMIINRKNKMAADLLTTGKCEIKGYADDAKTQLLDTVDYKLDKKQIITPATAWSEAGADIFADIKAASEFVQENAGLVPTVMIAGKNIVSYFLNNDKIMKWLMVPNAANLQVFNIAPHIVTPQVSMVGFIPALNLSVVSYAETYVDDDGTVKPFIPDDSAIIGVPGRGKQLHGAVTLLNDSDNGFNTFAAPYVPFYSANRGNQSLALTMYSRCVLAPESTDDWAVINAKG